MRNIFISSTFRDMQAERDLVQEKVLPALKEEARKYGDTVGVIDLRWGVDTSTLETEEGSAKVLTVCLDEIDRSHPYMLIFLGERYGWIPEGTLIEKAIRNRKDKYMTGDFEKSVTALEIEYGALSEQYGDLSRCIVCFREPISMCMDTENEAVYAEQTEVGMQKLRELKKRIKRDLKDERRLITYTCAWDASTEILKEFKVGEETLEDVLTKEFIRLFQNDWKEYEKLSWQEKEQLVFRALLEEKLHTFVGREELLENYYQRLVAGTKPLILRGEVGSGKTSLISKLVVRLKQEGKQVFLFFAGEGHMSTNADLLVQQMLYFVETILGEAHLEDSTNAEKSKYEENLERLKLLCFDLKEKIYFCLDGLERLVKDEHTESLDFLFHNEKICMLMSCANEFELNSVIQMEAEILRMPSLTAEEAKLVAKSILRGDSRDTYTALEEEMLQKKEIGNPLYISLLIQRLNMMDAEELKKVHTGKEIAEYGVEVIRTMPEEVSKAAVAILKNAVEKISEQDETILMEAVHFIAVSRKGLRMEDLKKLFEMEGKSLSVLSVTMLMRYLDAFFYHAEKERIDFTHKVIRQGVLHGLKEKERYERTLKEYCKRLPLSDSFCVQEGMYYARVTEDIGFARKLMEQAYVTKDGAILRAITEETIEDEGEFCCRILRKEMQENTEITDFVLYDLVPSIMKAWHQEVAVKLLKVVIQYAEEQYAKEQSEENRKRLKDCYIMQGNASTFNVSAESVSGLERALDILKGFNEEQNNAELALVCYTLGSSMMQRMCIPEAQAYFEMGAAYAENAYKEENSNRNLKTLADMYHAMGLITQKSCAEEAACFYEKALNYRKELYEKQKDWRMLAELSAEYLGYAQMQKYSEDITVYLEKGLQCAEEFNQRKRNVESVVWLQSAYKDAGIFYMNAGRLQTAKENLEKALHYAKLLVSLQKNSEFLDTCFAVYKAIGQVLLYMNLPEEALSACREAVKYAEEACKVKESEISLSCLKNAYEDVCAVLSLLVSMEKNAQKKTKLIPKSAAEKAEGLIYSSTYDSYLLEWGQYNLKLSRIEERITKK